MPAHGAETKGRPERRIKRPVVSEQDGSREGGLVVCIALIAGMVFAGAMYPGALASFWVWLGLLCMATGCGVSVKRLSGQATTGEAVA